MKSISGAIILTALLILNSCSVFRETSEVKNFARCEFHLVSTENMKLAGIKIQGLTSFSQLSLLDVAKIKGKKLRVK